jgi:hypothetical protein
MTKEEAKTILKELHDNSLFSVRTALETFFPEFKCRGLYVKGADLVKELKDRPEDHEEEQRRKHGLISLSELDEIMQELRRHMDEALPEFTAENPVLKEDKK